MTDRERRSREHREKASAMRLARKQIRCHRKPDRVRHKDWLRACRGEPTGPDRPDLPASERVMPRGECERRRTHWAEALATREGDSLLGERAPEAGPTGRGLVTEVSTGLCRVDVGGRSLVCGVRGSLSAAESGFTNVVAVGDKVVVRIGGPEQGMVEAVLPRHSALARPDVFYPHLQQVIAANVDQLLIVASWREPAFWPELVDRYLIAARRSRLSPILCVNKIDLATDPVACQATLDAYEVAGYRVLRTSAVTGEGMEVLRAALRGRATVLAGLSGVGKSSLLAVVQPGLRLRVGDVSARRHEGRHTTSQVNLHRLDSGGFVVDAPGMRELGLAGLRRQELAGYYPELAPLAAGCRFADCSHMGEPGCAVRQAVEEGRVAALRYGSYRKIYRDLPA